MQNLRKKLVTVGSMALGFLTVAAACHAQVPTADLTITSDTSNLVTGLNNAGISGLGIVITVGGVLLVTAALVFWVIRHFRALVHI